MLAPWWTALLIALPSLAVADYCSSYAECVAVSRLEERLCLGNSQKRPYWLPESTDPHNCHEQLKGDYQRLERLEIELDTAFVNCMAGQNSTQESPSECPRHERQSPKFAAGRTIDYVPTWCFTGVDRRIARQCGPLKGCCEAVNECEALLTNSPEFDRIKAAAFEMRNRAEHCERGNQLPGLPDFRSTVHSKNGLQDPFERKPILTPSGTITITVTQSTASPPTTSVSTEEGHEATTVTSKPLKVEGSASTTPASTYNSANSQIFDRLDKHEKQVKELLEKEGVDGGEGLLTNQKGEAVEQPRLTFPPGTIGQGAATEVQVPASGNKLEETEADFGLSIEREDQ
ncbi:unnamed protein product, partial [Mesorhabditis spiculigera]